MAEKFYLVMREKGIHTDGHTYYEAETTIMGARGSMEDACKLLEKVVKKYHSEDKPSQGTYSYEVKMDTSHIYRLEDGLTDSFWIKSMIVGPEGDQY